MDERPSARAQNHGGRSTSFEDLVLSVLAGLPAATADEFDETLRQALGTVGAALGASRVSFYAFSPDGEFLSATHEWVAEGVPSVFSRMQNVPVSAYPWVTEMTKKGLAIELPSPVHVPQEAQALRGEMEQNGVRSILTVPVRVYGRVVGGMSFSWLGNAVGTWTPTAVKRLGTLGDMSAGVLARVRTERELRQTDERFRSFIASTEESVFCYELAVPASASLTPEQLFEDFLHARLVLCNDVYARTRGAARPDAIYGRTMSELALSPLEELRGGFVRLVRNASREDTELTQNFPDGSVRIVRARGHLVCTEGSILRLWGRLRDITAEKKSQRDRELLEVQLHQAQKMESIGLLAGGIAHDFNNLLLVVMNYAYMAREEVQHDTAQALTALDQIISASERAAELTRGLLTFSRRQPVRRQPLNLNEIVRGILTLLRPMIRESIEIDFTPGHALGTVDGDRAQMEQVLVNLCMNGADAIADVGRITIETENVRLNGAYVQLHPWARPGRYVLLTVSDTGHGMPAEVRDRAFEPFFTTKEPGRGTGLGLAVVYGVVKQHDGMIHIYSEVDHGTTFKIYLPIVEREASSVGGKLEPAVVGGNETILVAEDHELVRAVVRSLLERAGYRVLVAKDGGEALSLFETHGDKVDLVLLDAVMPVVSGHIVHQHIVARRPDLPILIASGYTSTVFPEDFFARNGQDLIAKPYDADQLLRRVRQALNARKTNA